MRNSCCCQLVTCWYSPKWVLTFFLHHGRILCLFFFRRRPRRRRRRRHALSGSITLVPPTIQTALLETGCAGVMTKFDSLGGAAVLS